MMSNNIIIFKSFGGEFVHSDLCTSVLQGSDTLLHPAAGSVSKLFIQRQMLPLKPFQLGDQSAGFVCV